MQALKLILLCAATAHASFSRSPVLPLPQRTEPFKSNQLSTPLLSCLNLRGGSSAAHMDYRYFVAGGVCAAISHGITTPVDVVKTRLQSDANLKGMSPIKAAKQLVSTEGVAFLLAGLGPTVVGYGIEGAMKFGVYEILKPIVGEFIDSKAIAYMVASIMAGAVAAVLVCPMESARIRLVTDPKFGKGLLDTLPKLIAEDGVMNLFGGLWAMLAKQVPYTMTKQVGFDLFAIVLYGLANNFDLQNVGSTKWMIR